MSVRKPAAIALLAFTLSMGAADPLLSQGTADRPHAVSFELGDARFSDGDLITIESITGPSEKLQSGAVYLVTGTYRLRSHASARLSTNVTTRGLSGPTQNHDAASQPRSIDVTQGEGRFTLYLHMEAAGYPHLSFYPSGGGGSFAGIYFGSGDSLLLRRGAGTDTVSR